MELLLQAVTEKSTFMIGKDVYKNHLTIHVMKTNENSWLQRVAQTAKL